MVNKSPSVVPIPPKKMKQGMAYSGKEKTIIMNVFKYFTAEFPEKSLTEIVKRTSKATGCSEKSIFSFRKEEVSPQGFREPSKKKVRKKININNRLVKYNENVRQAIRKIVYDLKSKNIDPSLSVLVKNIHGDSSLPNFSIMTLRRLLFDMGFSYEKNGNKAVLVEKNVDNKQPERPETIAKVPTEVPTHQELKENCERRNTTQFPQYVDNKVGNVDNSKFTAHPPIHPIPQYSQPMVGYQDNQHNKNIPTQMQIMFPHRIPPYHPHSAAPPQPCHPLSMGLHLKRNEHYGSPHPTYLPHNTVMH